MTIVFHGPAGSGKDTQADLLAKNYGFEVIGTGQMFREMYEIGDIDGIKAKEYWGRGRWVPNDMVYKMLNKWIEKFDKEKNWVFVSVVREKGQIPMFDELLVERNRELDKFVYFSLGEEKVLERLSERRICGNCGTTYHLKYKKAKVGGYCDKCGTMLTQREDDKPHNITQRLQEDARTIAPIVEEYRNRGVLQEVDASPSIEEIHDKVVELLNL